MDDDVFEEKEVDIDDDVFEEKEVDIDDDVFDEKEVEEDVFEQDFDDDLIEAYNFPLYIKRSIQELQGIATAIIYDNKVDDNEIRLLIEWLKAHKQIIDQYPLNELAPLIRNIIQVGKSTKESRDEILKTLSSFAADPQANATVENIFDNDCEVIFKNRKFAFTGKLLICERSKAFEIVSSFGGITSNTFTHDTDYLVIGDLGCTSWKYSRFGNKIEKAIESRQIRKSPFIISEQQFIEATKKAEPCITDRLESTTKPLNKSYVDKHNLKENILSGLTFMMTGSLRSDNFEVRQIIKVLGGKVTTSKEKKVDYLLLGEQYQDECKYEFAIDNGVKLLNEDEFYSMIGFTERLNWFKLKPFKKISEIVDNKPSKLVVEIKMFNN